MKVLIVTYNKFPNGDAGAVRQAAFAHMLQNKGHEVYVIGMGPSTQGESLVFEGISYTSFCEKRKSIIDRFLNSVQFKNKLHAHLIQNKYDAIIAVDMPISAFSEIKKYSINNNIPIIHDSVEWYSADEFALGIFHKEYIKKDYRNRFYFDSHWKIIAISTYLENHFSQKGIKTLRIPAIMESKECPLKNTSDDKTVIMYAGLPGKKDCFDNILEAITLLDDNTKARLDFRIFGITLENLKNTIKLSNEKWKAIDNVVTCYGRVSREEVIKQLLEADYTILLRKADKRYAKAGFSTKIVESLSYATPVICNLSSDLGLYLKDMENSIIIENNTAEDTSKALLKGINAPKAIKEQMRQNALNTAKNSFDIKNFEEALDEFIKDK